MRPRPFLPFFPLFFVSPLHVAPWQLEHTIHSHRLHPLTRGHSFVHHARPRTPTDAAHVAFHRNAACQPVPQEAMQVPQRLPRSGTRGVSQGLLRQIAFSTVAHSPQPRKLVV